jgi:hypothetical protein
MQMSRCEARLTSAGEAVLDGQADALAMNGIEDQIGGVTLNSTAGPVWVRTKDGLTRG